jgi:hypothetical protein
VLGYVTYVFFLKSEVEAEQKKKEAENLKPVEEFLSSAKYKKWKEKRDKKKSK